MAKKPKAKAHQCEECPKSYGLRKHLLHHQRQIHLPILEKFVCHECSNDSVKYTTIFLLRDHLKDKHQKIVNLEDLAGNRIQIRNTKECEYYSVEPNCEPNREEILERNFPGDSYLLIMSKQFRS